MSYLFSKPSPLLSKFIKNYWAIENCLANGATHIQRIVPSGLPEFTFYVDNLPVLTHTKTTSCENSLVTGQLNRFYDIQVSGNISLFAVSFNPHGLAIFLDIPISEFYNQNIPLKYLLKDEFSELETKLYEAKSFSEKIFIAEQHLIKLLQKAKHRHHLNRIDNCIKTINTTKGIVDIDFLASEACFSRKQFERTFARFIGISPKKFLKTIRFQNAVNEKSKNANLNLIDLTVKCGYYDQSHMINDFQQLSGLTPKQYFSTCAPYSDYFSA